MKRIMMLMSALLVMLASYSGNGNIKYVVARNYFHNNNAPMPKSLKITSVKEFDEQFGAAAFMGKDGEATKIDFKKSFVIAKVLPVTDQITTLRMISLKKTSSRHLQMKYQLKQGSEHQSYSTQPIMIIVVDKKYQCYHISESVER
jgi:hypothetical protein